MIVQIIIVIGLLIANQFLAPVSMAGSFRITPTKIELSSSGDAKTIRLTKADGLASTVQISAVTWDSDIENNPVYVDDVMIFPPIVQFNGDDEQVIRLAARDLSDEEEEKAYILYLREIPNQIESDGTNLTFALNMKVPLFVTPPSAKPKVDWLVKVNDSGETTLSVVNSGKAHLRVNKIEFPDIDGVSPFAAINDGTYVFHGREKDWPLKKDGKHPVERIAIKAQTNIGPIETILALPVE